MNLSIRALHFAPSAVRTGPGVGTRGRRTWHYCISARTELQGGGQQHSTQVRRIYRLAYRSHASVTLSRGPSPDLAVVFRLPSDCANGRSWKIRL
jgi:hypothetical protein